MADEGEYCTGTYDDHHLAAGGGTLQAIEHQEYQLLMHDLSPYYMHSMHRHTTISAC